MSTPTDEIAALRARWGREWQEFQGRFTAEMDRIEALIRDTHHTMTDPIDIAVVRIIPRAVPDLVLQAFERGLPMSQTERLRILMRLRHLEAEVASFKSTTAQAAAARAPIQGTSRRRRARS